MILGAVRIRVQTVIPYKPAKIVFTVVVAGTFTAIAPVITTFLTPS